MKRIILDKSKQLGGIAAMKRIDKLINSIKWARSQPLSLDEVERITGYDFFPALPEDIENEVEAHASIDDWR